MCYTSCKRIDVGADVCHQCVQDEQESKTKQTQVAQVAKEELATLNMIRELQSGFFVLIFFFLLVLGWFAAFLCHDLT